jgi:O-antigen ligase
MIPLLGGYMWLYIHRPFEYWTWLGTVQIERIYMVFLLACWTVAARKHWLPNRLHAALAFFAVVLAAAWLASPYLDLGWLAVESYFKVAVFFLILVTTVRDERGLRRLVFYYVVAAHLYMLHSLLEFANGRNEFRMGITRLIGVDFTYAEPNEFASSLLYTLPFVAALWPGCAKGWRRLFLRVHVMGVVGCILLTGSRAGFAALMACGLITLLLSRRKKGLVLALGAATTVVALALPGPLQNRFLTILDPSYGPANAHVSASSRLDGLLLGVQVWLLSPLLGYGPSTFGFITKRGLGAHNVYGQVLSETGLLGALAFAGLLLCFLINAREARRWHARSGARPDDFAFLVCRAVGVNVVLLLVCGWAGHNLLRYNWQWFAAWQIIALHCLRARAPRVPSWLRAAPTVTVSPLPA